jgi:hypothetical protein
MDKNASPGIPIFIPVDDLFSEFMNIDIQDQTKRE